MYKQKTIRLFTGTYVDSDIFRFIYDDIKDDFRAVSFGKWVESENLHFTYHFIGDIPLSNLDELKDNLSGITIEYPDLLKLKGLKAFPNLKRPRVLHIPVYNNGILQEIYTNIGNVLDTLGYEVEKRKFKPHLTLQRIKDFDSEKFLEVVDKYKEYEFGVMSGFKVSLIKSKLTRQGPVYTVLQ